MSGDMNTSLGNGFVNLMLASFLCDEQGKELFGFVEGDDGLFVTDAILTKDHYAQLGFTIKIQTEESPCEAGFCGLIFSETGDVIRDWSKIFQTFGWTQSFLGAGRKIMCQLLCAKALSVLYESPQCPVVSALAHQALKHVEGQGPRWISDGFHTHVPTAVSVFSPSLETRCLYARKFGVSVEMQLEVEALIFQDDLQGAFELLQSTRGYSPSPVGRDGDDPAWFAARYVVPM